jgi:putative transcriptional regulator
MTITVHLDEVLEQRGMTLTQLSEEVGITLANLSILKTGKAKAVRFSTLESICAVLGCQPGDLLRWTQ